jgi:hypothetical protein
MVCLPVDLSLGTPELFSAGHILDRLRLELAQHEPTEIRRPLRNLGLCACAGYDARQIECGARFGKYLVVPFKMAGVAFTVAKLDAIPIRLVRSAIAHLVTISPFRRGEREIYAGKGCLPVIPSGPISSF